MTNLRREDFAIKIFSNMFDGFPFRETFEEISNRIKDMSQHFMQDFSNPFMDDIHQPNFYGQRDQGFNDFSSPFGFFQNVFQSNFDTGNFFHNFTTGNNFEFQQNGPFANFFNSNGTNHQNTSNQHQHEPTIIMKKITPPQYIERLECPICLNPFEYNVEYPSLSCGHLFHQECIKPWLEQHHTCPVCRANI